MDKKQVKSEGVLIVTQSLKCNRILVVKEPGKPFPIYYKFPGGSVEKGEYPVQAARRELMEESGLYIPDLGKFKVLDTIQIQSHTLVVFGAIVKSFKGVKRVGSTGEITYLHTLRTIYRLGSKLLPRHRSLLKFFHNGRLILPNYR